MKMTRALRNKRLQILNDAKQIILTNEAIVPVTKYSYVRITAKSDCDDNTFKLVSNWISQERNKQFDTSCLLDAKKTVCEVCALGALLLADIDRNNHATVGKMFLYNSRDMVEKRLKKLFSSNELRAIEAVFENSIEASNTAPKLYEAVQHRMMLDDFTVLLRILNFLIKNDSIVE